MKIFLGSRVYLIILPHVFLLFLLLWISFVPLEQIGYFSEDTLGKKRTDQAGFLESLNQIQTLLWSAIAFTAVIGIVILWMVSRRVLSPVSAIRNTIGQAAAGNLETRIRVHGWKELEYLANEFNGMMAHCKEGQARLRIGNRTLSAISACRRIMIHDANEKHLDQRICQSLVNIGAFRIAWIGSAEDEVTGTVTPVALAGYQNCDLNAVSALLAQTAFSPAARAVRNRHPAIICDVFDDPLFVPLQAEAVRHNVASVLALPLSVNQRTIGVLALYAEKSDAFGTEEIRLLTELADDLAHSLHAVRHPNKNKDGLQQLS